MSTVDSLPSSVPSSPERELPVVAPVVDAMTLLANAAAQVQRLEICSTPDDPAPSIEAHATTTPGPAPEAEALKTTVVKADDPFDVKKCTFLCEVPGGCENKQQYDRKFIRKTVSDCFGRNKKCTQKIKNPIIWCRSHYQQQAYHKARWIHFRIKLVKIQLLRNEKQQNGLRYMVVLLKSECNRVHSILQGQGDLPPPPSGSLRGQPYRAPEWALLQLVERFIGEQRTYKECIKLLDWIEKHADMGHLKSFPEIEFLPSWKDFEKELGTCKEQVRLLKLAKDYVNEDGYKSDDLPEDRDLVIKKPNKPKARPVRTGGEQSSNTANVDVPSPGEDAGDEHSDTCLLIDSDETMSSDDEMDIDEPQPAIEKNKGQAPSKFTVTKLASTATSPGVSSKSSGKRRMDSSAPAETHEVHPKQNVTMDLDDPSDATRVDTPHATKKPRLSNPNMKPTMRDFERIARTNLQAAMCLATLRQIAASKSAST